jgi:hypothetical protein
MTNTQFKWLEYEWETCLNVHGNRHKLTASIPSSGKVPTGASFERAAYLLLTICYFLFLNFKYSLRNFVFKHPKSVFFAQSKWLGFEPIIT